MQAGARSEKGRARAQNQDSFALIEMDSEGLFFLACADGIGGQIAGDIASSLAVSRLVEHVQKASSTGELFMSLSAAMAQGFSEANRAVLEQAELIDGRVGMGTTLTAAVVWGSRVCLGHVGDTRAYLLHNSRLEQVTSDHSLVGELFRKGDITEDEAMRHPQRNVITRALGAFDQVAVDISERDFECGFAVVLCSDGVTGYVRSDEIMHIIGSGGAAQQCAEEIVQRALERGTPDDATCVVLLARKIAEGGAAS
jgi:protein phosphatase